MIGRRAEVVLNRAVRFAVEQEHEYFTLEHVLWSLLADLRISETIQTVGGNPTAIRKELEVYLRNEVPKAGRLDPSLSQEASEFEVPSDERGLEHPVATLSIQRLIQRALFHVQSSGKDEIQPEDLLVALFQAKDSKALMILIEQGIERLDLLKTINQGVHSNKAGFIKEGVKTQAEGDDSHSESHSESSEEGHSPKSSPGRVFDESALSHFVLNLNDQAKQGKMDPLIGRKTEVERLIQILCRRKKNNPLLVGEAGVGKTAIAEGLAVQIVEKKVPELLQNTVIYSLDLGALLAGAKFRGDFEQRFKRLIQTLEKKKEKGIDPLLFIDEIHTIIGAGAVSGGALDAAHLMKPLLSQGLIRFMGSTTYSEFRNVFEKDHALVRRFQKVEVVESTLQEAFQILEGLKTRFEEYHEVEYTKDALQAAVDLSSKHLIDRFLPDKAIDVMDEAGAKARLQKEKKGDIQKLDSSAIEAVVSQMARIPPRSVSLSQKLSLKNLKTDLQLSIFGQDHAVEALVGSIRLARSGLRTGEKPVGSFLFCGPTGVGKTELSKQLAHCLGVPFLRFDMSEYSEKHTVSRLIGAPPGYVGFDQAGLLTDSVLKKPYSVVLLDEIEKAHSDICNILLQVMDHGLLTDHNGRKADFRNSILIMTSNVGSRELERRPLGMGPEDFKPSSFARKEVEQTFSPEFRNRLDAVIYFHSLAPEIVEQVVGKQLMELESQLLGKNVDVEFDGAVKKWLTQKGYDRWMGARPLARLIQDQIKRPLAEEILFGRLESGGKVKVLIKNDEIAFKFRQKIMNELDCNVIPKATQPHYEEI